MKATCPNSEEHKAFTTVAHVSQDWKVDDEGNFLACVGDIEVIAPPNPYNIWTCEECGAEAEVEE